MITKLKSLIEIRHHLQSIYISTMGTDFDQIKDMKRQQFSVQSYKVFFLSDTSLGYGSLVIETTVKSSQGYILYPEGDELIQLLEM